MRRAASYTSHTVQSHQSHPTIATNVLAKHRIKTDCPQQFQQLCKSVPVDFAWYFCMHACVHATGSSVILNFTEAMQRWLLQHICSLVSIGLQARHDAWLFISINTTGVLPCGGCTSQTRLSTCTIDCCPQEFLGAPSQTHPARRTPRLS